MTRRIVGTPQQVRARLERLHAAGELVTLSPPTPVGRGQVSVTVQVRALASSKPPRPALPVVTRRGLALAVGVTVAGLAVLGALVWAAVVALGWLADHWAGVVGALILAALLLAALGKTGACVGIHCPGCRHR